MQRAINFITIHPDLVRSVMQHGPLLWAQEAGKVCCNIINLRDFAVDGRGSVDDRPYGGGDGMVMRLEPLVSALRSLPSPGTIIMPTPAGRVWHDRMTDEFARSDAPLTFICPRFGGVDERLFSLFAITEISLGDFVVSGGELPALLIADSILRKVEGVLGNEASAATESFSAELAGRLEHPLYTRPVEFEGRRVPDVLLSGDHARIEAWRAEERGERTRTRRPDLVSDE